MQAAAWALANDIQRTLACRMTSDSPCTQTSSTGTTDACVCAHTCTLTHACLYSSCSKHTQPCSHAPWGLQGGLKPGAGAGSLCSCLQQGGLGHSILRLPMMADAASCWPGWTGGSLNLSKSNQATYELLFFGERFQDHCSWHHWHPGQSWHCTVPFSGSVVSDSMVGQVHMPRYSAKKARAM